MSLSWAKQRRPCPVRPTVADLAHPALRADGPRSEKHRRQPGRRNHGRPRRRHWRAPQSRDLALAYRALPAADLPPMATKPVTPSSLRAFFTASAQAFRPFFTHCFFPCAEAFFDTTLPALFLMSLSFVKPVPVFCFLPEKTRALAPLPRAMTLTFFAFMAPAFFIPAFFIAAAFFFIAAAFFITAFFIGSAMVKEMTVRGSGKERSGEEARRPTGEW